MVYKECAGVATGINREERNPSVFKWGMCCNAYLLPVYALPPMPTGLAPLKDSGVFLLAASAVPIALAMRSTVAAMEKSQLMTGVTRSPVRDIQSGLNRPKHNLATSASRVSDIPADQLKPCLHDERRGNGMRYRYPNKGARLVKVS